MASLDHGIARILSRAQQLPSDQRAAYIGENIAHQQRVVRKFTTGMAPAGWSLDQSEQMLQRLITLQALFRAAERVAA